MKNLFYALFFVLFACTSPNTIPDMTLYNANLEIVKKAMACYETPQDFETFKTLICESVKHQSPMYGQGVVDYDGVMEQAQFYMNGFSNVKFENAKWLPGVDTVNYQNNGSVRVYGTWTGTSNASGKEFAVDSYHYFYVKDGKITASGDYFDATGMVMALAPDQEMGK